MAFDQSKAFTQLENIIKEQDKENFFFDFMLAFKTPRATITKLKNNIGSDVSSSGGEYRLKNKIHFKPVSTSTDLHAECDFLKSLPTTPKDKIRFLFVTDFQDVVAYDMKAKALLDVEFVDLHKNYAFFLPLAGIEKYELTDEHPADIKAAYKLGQLCDVIRRHNEIDTPDKVHAFNVFLTRLLFCFYAEDTGIFSDNQLINSVQNTTDKNGSDLDIFFERLFHVLNLPNESKERLTLPLHFADFPYVNGGLFASEEWVPKFTGKARRMIIEAGSLEWDQINPDIFGSMFQSVIDPKQRGKLGQHYTSVPNIMKVIQPLFLDSLYDALEEAKNSTKRLQSLLMRIQRISVFDSACGSGNFLIIAYKELRKFEMKVFKALDALGEQSVMFMSGIRLTQFYGIEIDDFAHEIALLSLWLAENQMNKLFEAEFGYSEPMLPLKDSGNVIHGNALRLDWEKVCPKQDEHGDLEVYVCGNPPFVHSKKRTDEQNADMERVLGHLQGFKMIDYVGCWFEKCRLYVNKANASGAFVSTNSLCQGEQVSRLWPNLLTTLEIIFAVQAFPWSNSAKDKAGVHVVVIGFKDKEQGHIEKRLYKNDKKRIQMQKVKNINPYLVEGSDSVVFPRSLPLCDAEPMVYGNYYSKSAGLILNRAELESLLSKEPHSEQYVKKLMGSDEFIHGKQRWCLWLVDLSAKDLANYPEIQKRVESVRLDRLNTSDKAMNAIASTPHIFRDTRNPDRYLLIPIVSSERREYIPIGYLDKDTIATNKAFMLPNASLYTFGIICSSTHMDWMRATSCGRLESRYSYSNKIVYNNFPWPEATEKSKAVISELAEEILLTRADYPDKTLAQLYDPEEMPQALRIAHKNLDLAVEKLYRAKPFEDESERVAFLFKRYEQLINTKEGNDA